MDRERASDCSGRVWLFVAASLLVLSVWCLFGTVGGFDFLRLDDHDYTYRCAFVRDGLSWPNVRDAFVNVRHGGIWMPVTYISYMAGISLFGPGAGAHHLVNIAIHSVNAVLLLWLVARLCRASRAQFATAAVLVAMWAIHPQRAEAVAWIAGRKELLCATFVLGGLLCWLRARKGAGRGCRFALVGTYACFALACMSKPTAMCFPFLVLAVDGLVRYPAVGRRRLVLNFMAFLAIAAATGALAIYSQTHPEGHAVRDIFSASLPWRLLNAATATGLYVFQMFIPVGIHLDYRAVPEGWPLHGALGFASFAIAVLALVWACRRRNVRIPLLALSLWFVASLAPTLGIFGSFGEHARADRFFYIPSMAVPIGAALLTECIDWRRRKAAVCGLAVCAVALFVACRPVVASYQNDVAAFARTIEFDPGHGRALAHLGEARCAAGDLAAGIDLLRRSREVRPRDATDAKLAYALMRRGRPADWTEIRSICAAIAADPARDVRGQGLEALGTAELVARDWANSARHLAASVRAPGRHYSSADAILKLAFAQHNGGRRDEAHRLFEWVASRSGREDLAARARQVLAVLETSPHGILFW